MSGRSGDSGCIMREFRARSSNMVMIWSHRLAYPGRFEDGSRFIMVHQAIDPICSCEIHSTDVTIYIRKRQKSQKYIFFGPTRANQMCIEKRVGPSE